MRLHMRVVSLMVAAGFLVAAVVPINALAQGRFTIKPYIETGIEHDSNFHRSENNTKEVFTYYLRPGVDFSYVTDRSLVGFGYDLTIYRYDDRDDYLPGETTAEEYDFTGHTGRFFFETNPGDHLKLKLDNNFFVTREPATADPNSNSVDRFKYTLNKFEPGMDYRFNEKFGLGLKYTNLLTDYSDDGAGQGEDSMEHRGTITGTYFLNSRTSMDLDYQYWERDYDKLTSDYTSSQVMVKVNHRINRLKLTAGAGYQNREFDDSAVEDDIDTVVWQLGGTWQLPKSQLLMRVSSNLNDAGNGNSYYNATRLDAEFKHQLTDRIYANLAGYYMNADYETFDREDDLWHVSLGADYLFNDFFTVGVGGGFEERDSTEIGRDYDNRFFLIKARFNYDIFNK